MDDEPEADDWKMLLGGAVLAFLGLVLVLADVATAGQYVGVWRGIPIPLSLCGSCSCCLGAAGLVLGGLSLLAGLLRRARTRDG